MAKTITLEYEDKEYVLEFSRDSITAMERSGFDLAKVNSKPLSVAVEELNQAKIKILSDEE